jgi:hypothetical protein
MKVRQGVSILDQSDADLISAKQLPNAYFACRSARRCVVFYDRVYKKRRHRTGPERTLAHRSMKAEQSFIDWANNQNIGGQLGRWHAPRKQRFASPADFDLRRGS